jgi:hypothetical protein
MAWAGDWFREFVLLITDNDITKREFFSRSGDQPPITANDSPEVEASLTASHNNATRACSRDAKIIEDDSMRTAGTYPN